VQTNSFGSNHAGADLGGLRELQPPYPPYSHKTPLEQEVDRRGEGRRKEKKSGK